MTTHHITVGGALIGLIATAIVLVNWYRKHGSKGGGEKGAGRGRNLSALAPFLWAFTLGVLCSLATGGWMGQTALRIDQGSNLLGNRVLSSLAGADSPGVTRVGIAMLSPDGSAVLVLVLIGVALWFWGSRKAIKWQMIMGLLGGCTLGPTAGVAGVAGVILAPAANMIGSWLVGAL